MALSHYVTLAVLLAAASAEETTFRRCSGVRDHCEVSKVRITPCADKGRCKFPQGINATLSFDFTPQFAATSLKTQVSYNNLPLRDLNEDACLLTTCPSVSGTSQTFNYVLPIGLKMPTGTYPISWKVWNADNPDEDVCCFKTTIKIVKST